MNKLQEAIQKFSKNLAYDSDDTHLMYFDCSPDTIKEGLAKIIVEYARSKVPTDGENPYFTHNIEYKHLLEVFNIIDNSIQQDLQSLNK